MFRLDRVLKPWKDTAALNDHINLYGFWNDTVFLTKSGDPGVILHISGVDYESLDSSEQERMVKRLESALKAFGPGFHVYQYLFKTNCPHVPFATYDDPLVAAVIDQRRQFFAERSERLYQIDIFYAVVLEGARSKRGVGAALKQFPRDPAGAVRELKAQFSNNNMKVLLRKQIETDLGRLEQRVVMFTRQLTEFMQIEKLNQEGQLTFFRRLLNFDTWRIAGKPQSNQFLDYQVATVILGVLAFQRIAGPAQAVRENVRSPAGTMHDDLSSFLHVSEGSSQTRSALQIILDLQSCSSKQFNRVFAMKTISWNSSAVWPKVAESSRMTGKPELGVITPKSKIVR